VQVVEAQRPQSLHDRRTEGAIHEYRRDLLLWCAVAQYLTGKRTLRLAAETRLNFALQRPLIVRTPAQSAKPLLTPKG
jgi:hypothetical protein